MKKHLVLTRLEDPTNTLEKFTLWDPSLSNQGKHVNDFPYRYTATL